MTLVIGFNVYREFQHVGVGEFKFFSPECKQHCDAVLPIHGLLSTSQIHTF